MLFLHKCFIVHVHTLNKYLQFIVKCGNLQMLAYFKEPIPDLTNKT